MCSRFLASGPGKHLRPAPDSRDGRRRDTQEGGGNFRNISSVEYAMTASFVGLVGHKAEINVTPMIDVLLVLIIIFMVITPLASIGLQTLVPPPPVPDKEQSIRFNDIVITVEKDKTVLLNRERVDIAGLPERLARLVQTRGNDAIFVRGDKDLEFRQIAEVIDIANGARLRRVALMTQ
jgi:biopolymer transport protein TolR